MRSQTTRSLQAIVEEHAAPAADALYDKRDHLAVQCHACAHECVIADGHSGICRVRINRAGTLYAPRGYVEGLAVDPIEKKPFYHVTPGASALSFGMLGCNFTCAFCQNWYTAQAIREEKASATIQPITADEIVDLALQERCRCLISTYNEPLITTDWAAHIFDLAQPHGLLCGYVSNGFATPQVMRFLCDRAQLYKIDLKTFNDRNYRVLGGRLQPVLDSIILARQLGFWVEVVTLIVPQFNDSPDELRAIARFIASVSPDIPWHVTAFYPQYKMQDRGPTPAATLRQAWQIGREQGLHFVYAGNLPNQVDSAENTYCPTCRKLLIERTGFTVAQNQISAQGRCPHCNIPIPGIWS